MLFIPQGEWRSGSEFICAQASTKSSDQMTPWHLNSALYSTCTRRRWPHPGHLRERTLLLATKNCWRTSLTMRVLSDEATWMYLEIKSRRLFGVFLKFYFVYFIAILTEQFIPNAAVRIAIKSPYDKALSDWGPREANDPLRQG